MPFIRIRRGESELPRFVRAYYDQLQADYEAADIPLELPLKSPATWDGLYRLEMANLRARAGAELRRSAWLVRLRFRNVAGESGYASYANSAPPDPATAAEDVLRADLLNLVRRTYYLIALAPSSESIRHAMIICGAVIGVLTIGVIFFVLYFGHGTGIFQLMVLGGAAGGTMSLIQRVQALPEADPLLFRLSGTTTIIQSLIIPPLTGAMFAGFLFFMFASKVVEGVTFPNIVVPPATPNGIDFSTFLFTAKPDSGKSFALAIVWAFVAGFAERFVPDTINRLTRQASEQKAKTAKGRS
jgi:hypothetical protein